MSHQSEFSVLPADDELRQVLRDLRFVPSNNPQPVHLTKDQIEQFNELGYLIGFRVYSPDEMEKIRGYFDQLLEQVIAAGVTVIQSVRPIASTVWCGHPHK
ncbi:MAG: hypothetical protein R3C11_15800 [Planctomycetaceae bacterium]